MEYKFDIDEIKEQIEQVLRYSQCYSVSLSGIDNIVDKWLKAKEYYIQLMNGNLIYEYPQVVSFELSDTAKRSKIKNFTDTIYNRYGDEVEDLCCFLDSLRMDDFYSNLTSQVYDSIPEKYKVVKAFKFFIEDPELLKELQNEASRIIQENVISGHLCFSVHPLDFLSASENVHNWRSCHALDGEYRSGNLNYLCDESTVICYLRGENDAILPRFPSSVPWNSKKWRVWFFFSQDKTMLFAGRQYPFEAMQGINLIKDTILPILGLNQWSAFSRDKINHHRDSLSNTEFYFKDLVPVGDTAIALSELVKDGSHTFHYNDILRSSVYDPIYSYRLRGVDCGPWSPAHPTGMTDNDTRFVIGEACPCPVCGDNYIDFNEAIACSSCCDRYGLYDDYDFEECEICGSSVYYEDLITLDVSGIRVCQECYDTETLRCQNCGAVDTPEYIKRREGDTRRLCPSCYEDAVQNSRKIEDIEFQI